MEKKLKITSEWPNYNGIHNMNSNISIYSEQWLYTITELDYCIPGLTGA